jgi:hypothetical protein
LKSSDPCLRWLLNSFGIQADAKVSPTRPGFYAHIGMITAKQTPGNIQTKTGSLAGRFGCKKGIKDFRDQIRCNTRPISF